MASYRQYRSVSNYNREQRRRYGSSGLRYDDPYVRYNLKDVPVIGSALRASDWQKYWNDYLRNIHQDWSYVRYPALLSGTSWTGAVVGGLSDSAGMMISKNLMRMYR